jgi:glutathione S-transferase
MPYVAIVTVLALAQFIVFGVLVGRARSRCGVQVPATSGHPEFERYFRVHMNTLEQLVLFLPALWIFAWFVSPPWAAVAGVVYLIGRVIYAVAYVREPKRRTLGFALTILPTQILMLGTLIWAVRALIVGQT